MDPDVALERMREIVTDYDHYDNDDRRNTACSELVDIVSGIDDWMSKGGYAPTAWTRTDRS